MKKHIIILFIMTLFAGMTLSAQSNQDSVRAKIKEILKREDVYIHSEHRDNDKEVAKEEALNELKKHVKEFFSGQKLTDDEWEEHLGIIDDNVQILEYQALPSISWRVFVYLDKDVLVRMPGAVVKRKTVREEYYSKTTEIVERTVTHKGDNVTTTQTQTTVEGSIPQQDIDRMREAMEALHNEEPKPADEAQPKEEPKPVEVVTPKEEPKPAEAVPPKEESKPVEVVTPKEEPKPVEVVTPKEEPKPVEVVQPKEESKPVNLVQPQVDKPQRPQSSNNNMQLVEVMPDVPESAVKLSLSSEFKYTENDTTGIAEFMRAVINCRTLNQVYDLVTNYKKDGANIDYKKPATSKDTDYYLVLYQRTSGKLEAILSPSARGEVVNIITGELDGLQNHPGTSFAGFKINVE